MEVHMFLMLSESVMCGGPHVLMLSDTMHIAAR